MKMPAVSLAFLQDVERGSENAYKQPVSCCGGNSCPARGSVQAVGLCSSSCFRTFGLNLSEISSIRPILNSFFFFPACGNSSGTFVLQNV